jgi:hypothetical protein
MPPNDLNVVDTRFFLTLYGAQTTPNWLRTAHTFAVFSKIEYYEDGSAKNFPSILSWLPASGVIHLIGEEPGRNYTMPETLAFVAGADIYATPTAWIVENLYTSALERISELQGGKVAYIMSDRMSTRPHHATNCIHAVSDIPIVVATLPMLDTKTLHGFSASWAVYNHLSPWFVAVTDGQMAEALKPIPGIEVMDEEKVANLNQESVVKREAIGHLIEALNTLLPNYRLIDALNTLLPSRKEGTPSDSP